MKAIFSMLLLAKIVSNALLSSVNFATYSSCSDYAVFSNPVGMAMDFPTVSQYFNDQLFQRYLLNSNIYGNWNSNFRQYIHVPVGYKYNCTLVAEIGGNNTSNCTYDLKNNTLLKQMGDYVYNTTQYYSYFMGWDMQNSNFGDNSYLQNVFIAFVRDFYKLAKQPFSIELVDRGNLFQQLGIRENYTASLLVQDCMYVNKVFYGLGMSGPGTTASADSLWYAKNGEISYYCGVFTFRVVAFPNKSDLTISNLLSDKYTSQLLRQRLTVNGTSYINDLVYYYGDINDIRLVDDPMGVQGVTNSFAAAIWAIQIALQFYYLSGARINFYNPMLNGSFQNIIGPGPTFTPTIMYSALLFTNIIVANYPFVCLSQVKSAQSQNIKVYLLDYYQNSGILILNKDTNMSMSGEVGVTLKDVNGLNCIYLSAPNLSSTDGVTVGGLSITGSNSTFIGNYSEYEYNVDINGQYLISVNYSQAVYCYSKVDKQYLYFPTGKNAGGNIMVYSTMLLIIFMMAF